MENLDKVTRLVVIDHTKDLGNVIEFPGVKVEALPLQDDGRTLKIRVTRADHEHVYRCEECSELK